MSTISRDNEDRVYRCGLRFFFFQAEDGIRDLVRSRGLGDVYKRQDILFANEAEICSLLRIPNQELTTEEIENVKNQLPAICAITPVSYTHLTLPTSDLV